MRMYTKTFVRLSGPTVHNSCRFRAVMQLKKQKVWQYNQSVNHTYILVIGLTYNHVTLSHLLHKMCLRHLISCILEQLGYGNNCIDH